MTDAVRPHGERRPALVLPGGRLDLYQRDGRHIRRQAVAIIKMVDAFERNSKTADDTLRFLLIETYARELLRAATRPVRRWERAHPE